MTVMFTAEEATLETLKREEVTWDDHAGPFETIAGARLVSRVTLGYVVDEDDTTLLIAGTWDELTGYADINALGKGMITKRRKIK